MSEGWLFRLRSSLGAQHAAPAWPSARIDETPGLPPLRRPPAQALASAGPGDPATRASPATEETD